MGTDIYGWVEVERYAGAKWRAVIDVGALLESMETNRCAWWSGLGE